MATHFLELRLHTPDVRSTAGGGWIVPKRFTTDKDGRVELTPHCAGIEEIEWHINRMQADLEELRKRARKEFAKFKDMPLKPLFDSN